MARTGAGAGALLPRRNIKLDSFLKRNTERTVYERIRSYEPCVVISESVSKVYMYVVLSDESVYLAEYPPRTLTVAVTFRRVRDIELVNDFPDFLHGKDREICQHIKITYITEMPGTKGHYKMRRDRREGLPAAALSSHRASHCPAVTHTLDGHPANSETAAEEVHRFKSKRSASCPNPGTLGPLSVPPHPSLSSPASSPTSPLSPSGQRRNWKTEQVSSRIGSALSRLLGRDCVPSREKREAELHLYAVSQTSRLYLHLQSSWNSYVIRSTLLLDPLYRRISALSDSTSEKQLPAISWERTAQLYAQLSSELLQEGISVESLYLLLQELRTAAHRNITLRKVFWRASPVCVYLVHTLEESLQGCQSFSGVYTADQLL